MKVEESLKYNEGVLRKERKKQKILRIDIAQKLSLNELQIKSIEENLDTGFESKKFSAEFPLTDNLKLWGDRYEDDQGDSNNTNYGLGYYKQGDIGEMGNWFVDAGIDKDKD